MEESASHHLFKLSLPRGAIKDTRMRPDSRHCTRTLLGHSWDSELKASGTRICHNSPQPCACHLKHYIMIEFSQKHHFVNTWSHRLQKQKCWHLNSNTPEKVDSLSFSPKGHPNTKRWRRVLRTTYLSCLCPGEPPKTLKCGLTAATAHGTF